MKDNRNRKIKTWSLWILSFLFTLAIAYYQRVTGPTYPVTGKIIINEQLLEYKLLTSNDSHIPAEIIVKGNTQGFSGRIDYRRYRSNDEWKSAFFKSSDGSIIASMPPQPPAGKLEYIVILNDGIKEFLLTENPVVLRFKGAVPLYILIPHVICMFGAMFLSTRTGLEALTKGTGTLKMAMITLVLLGIGGLIFGPVMQKFAFGEFWTGWPFGKDLTDNKTLIAFIGWLSAYLKLRKDSSNRTWAIVASVILLAIFLIPHSMFGSELDYSTGKIETGK